MDLDAIAVFVKVVEAGSFSGAARLLKMPKTTVSAKVAALEKRLGVNLIQRTTRKLHITEAGHKYFHYCATAIRAVEQGESELLSSQTTPTGLLKITAPVDLGHTVLPRIVRTYLEKYPETTIELIISNQVVDLIGEGVDLGIRAGKLKDSSLIAKRFFDVTMNVWASPDYLDNVGRPKHPKDLSKLHFVGRTDQKAITFTNGVSEVEVPVASRVQVDDFETIKSLIIEGEGIGRLPDFLASDAKVDGTLVPVLAKWKCKSTGAFSFVYAGHKYASPKVQAFIATALEVIRVPTDI